MDDGLIVGRKLYGQLTFESGVSGISGLSGLSGRWRCNSSANIYGGCAQASLKSPYKSKCSRLPRLTIKPLSRKTQKRAHLPQGPFFSFFQLAIAMVDGISPAQPNFINPFNNDFIRFSLSNVFR